MQWREEQLLELLRNEKMKTGDLVDRANMSKTTALKYLESLKARGVVGCEMVGPTKLWFSTKEKKGSDDDDCAPERVHVELEKHIYIDKRVPEMLEEIERATGIGLNILVDKKGVRLIFVEG